MPNNSLMNLIFHPYQISYFPLKIPQNIKTKITSKTKSNYFLLLLKISICSNMVFLAHSILFVHLTKDKQIPCFFFAIILAQNLYSIFCVKLGILFKVFQIWIENRNSEQYYLLKIYEISKMNIYHIDKIIKNISLSIEFFFFPLFFMLFTNHSNKISFLGFLVNIILRVSFFQLRKNKIKDFIMKERENFKNDKIFCIFNPETPIYDDCSICLEPLNCKKLIKLNCSHIFHPLCIQKWIIRCADIEKMADCPMCHKILI